MLHRDYLLEIIARFVDSVIEAMGLALRKADPTAVEDVESAIAGLLDLDPSVALRLSPDSLVTMMILSGIGSAIADYVTYSLRCLGDAYELMGNDEVATLRREQAHAIAESFGCDYEVVPPEFVEFEQSRA